MLNDHVSEVHKHCPEYDNCSDGIVDVLRFALKKENRKTFIYESIIFLLICLIFLTLLIVSTSGANHATQ